MKESKAKKRERLMAKAGEIVDEYLEWEAKNPTPDLNGIEEIALRLRQELGREIAQTAVESQASERSVPGPKCKRCGREMRYKGEKTSQVESRVGQLKVERGHYYCPECQESIFPPGSATETER